MAIFLHRYAEEFNNDSASQYADQLLNAAVDRIAEEFAGPPLYGGFSGVGWAVNLLGKEDALDCSAIDEALLCLLETRTWNMHYDLIKGIVGVGVYALERLPEACAAKTLELIVGHLAGTAEQNDDCITWKTLPQWMPPQHRQLFPNGNYNLGMAHGVPGIIGFLGRVFQAGIGQPIVEKLLDGAVGWLLRQRFPVESDGWFGCVSGDDRAARLAWCYGDLGIAAGLLVAARCLGRQEWEAAAVEMAICAAHRSIEASQVNDAGLCHGSAGLGHLFNRLHQYTGHPVLLNAARAWFQITLQIHVPDRGIGGYQSFSPSFDQRVEPWQSTPGILVGSAGIGLGLLSAIQRSEPTWDRMFLVSD
jgi:lantibiotic modifying enzyme